MVGSDGRIHLMLDAPNGADWHVDHHTVHFLACRLQEAHMLAQMMRMGWTG